MEENKRQEWEGRVGQCEVPPNQFCVNTKGKRIVTNLIDQRAN